MGVALLDLLRERHGALFVLLLASFVPSLGLGDNNIFLKLQDSFLHAVLELIDDLFVLLEKILEGLHLLLPLVDGVFDDCKLVPKVMGV